MIETANSESHGLFKPEADTALESRVLRVMAISVAAAVLVSAPLAPWRGTTGLALAVFFLCSITTGCEVQSAL